MIQPTPGRRATKLPTVVAVGVAQAIADVLYSWARQEGYALVHACLSCDVLRVLRQRPVPLVVCDDSAPSMRSFELMTQIKQHSPTTHVVLIVPSGSPEQERRAREAGADTYLASLFALKHLRAIVKDIPN